MKKFTLRLSNRFSNQSGDIQKIILNADSFDVHGGGHNGIYIFKNKPSQLTDIMEWVACYPIEETIIEKIEDIKENE